MVFIYINKFIVLTNSTLDYQTYLFYDHKYICTLKFLSFCVQTCRTTYTLELTIDLELIQWLTFKNKTCRHGIRVYTHSKEQETATNAAELHFRSNNKWQSLLELQQEVIVEMSSETSFQRRKVGVLRFNP